MFHFGYSRSASNLVVCFVSDQGTDFFHWPVASILLRCSHSWESLLALGLVAHLALRGRLMRSDQGASVRSWLG